VSWKSHVGVRRYEVAAGVLGCLGVELAAVELEDWRWELGVVAYLVAELEG